VNLQKNIDDFTSAFLKNTILDYNIGVVTSTTDGTMTSVACCGKLVSKGGTSIVTRTTPSANKVLGQNLRVGTWGSGWENFFDPVQLALSLPLVNTFNAGFYRADAMLAVVFVTDADDQTTSIDANGFYNFLLRLKHNDAKKFLAYGAIIPQGAPCASATVEAPPLKLQQFLGMLPNNHNNVLSLCEPDFGVKLAQFAEEIVSKSASVIYLSRQPVPETIHVMYGNYELPKDPNTGWTFDPEMNAVILGRNVDWTSEPIGSKVTLRYDIGK
jgi:hypothetical protein